MAFEQGPSVDLTFVAAADLRTHQYKFVEISSGQVAVCNALTDVPIGVLQNKPNTGEAATVRVSGVSKVVADAALATVGTQVGTSADGKADAKTIGTDTTEYVRGITLEASGAEDDIIAVLLVDPHRAT